MASVSKRPEVIIRRLEIDDLSAVYRLGEELFTSEEYPILYRTWDPYEVTGLFTSDPEYCFVAETEDRVVGFALATTFEKEGTAWKRYGYVNWIGVSSEVQGLHVGSRLYRRLEEAFREDGVRMMIADTVVENENAIGFFRDLGFNTSGRHVWLTKTLRKEDGRDGHEGEQKKTKGKQTRRVAPDAPVALQSEYKVEHDG
ncbi:MAG: N-acetyltransferase family protein [Chloroflexota bacterium]